jgi:hypothetical protein
LDKSGGQISGGKISPLPDGSGAEHWLIQPVWMWGQGDPGAVWQKENKFDHLGKTDSELKLTDFQEKYNGTKSSILAPKLALQAKQDGGYSHTSFSWDHFRELTCTIWPIQKCQHLDKKSKERAHNTH